MNLLTQKPTKYSVLTSVIGASHDIYGRVGIYISAINTLMIFGVFYTTVVRTTPWLDWLSLPLFLLVILALVIFVSLLVWKIIIPQMMAYTNFQLYKHDNPIRKDIAELKEMLERLSNESVNQ